MHLSHPRLFITRPLQRPSSIAIFHTILPRGHQRWGPTRWPSGLHGPGWVSIHSLFTNFNRRQGTESIRHWGGTHQGSPLGTACSQIRWIFKQYHRSFPLKLCQRCWSGPSTISALYLISSHCPWCPLPFGIPLLLRSPTSPFSIHRAPGWRHDPHSRRYPQPHSSTISPVPRRPLLHPVATHYPHLHRLEDNNVEYGHYEDQPAEVQESRLYHDMRNHPHHCSGYRIIHWNPNLAQNSIHLQAKRVPNFSSLPRTTTPLMTSKVNSAHLPQITRPLFLIFISCASTAVTTCPPIATSSSIPTHKVTLSLQCHKASPLPISIGISQAMRLFRQTSNLGLLSLLLWNLPPATPAALPLTAPCPTQYTPSASEALHHYFSRPRCLPFWLLPLAADARNLVALTRSKGLSVLLLPTTQKFIDCSLHSILTQCAWRHGIFHVGTADLDTQALADYISQPDTTLNDQPSVFTSESWLYTHQITSFGRWDPLPLCLRLSQHTLVSYFCLSLNQHLPPANTAEITASSFEWKGLTPGPPNEPASIVFGRDSLVFTTEHAILAEFPYPTSDTTDPLTSTRYTLIPAAGSHFFARSSHSQGHRHPLRPSPPASHIPAPLCLQRWPSTSPAAVSPDLPSQVSSPPPQFLGATVKSLFLSGIEYLHSQDCIADPNLSAEARLMAPILSPIFPRNIVPLLSTFRSSAASMQKWSHP